MLKKEHCAKRQKPSPGVGAIGEVHRTAAACCLNQQLHHLQLVCADSVVQGCAPAQLVHCPGISTLRVEDTSMDVEVLSERLRGSLRTRAALWMCWHHHAKSRSHMYNCMR
jgi:hypothetical protein